MRIIRARSGSPTINPPANFTGTVWSDPLAPPGSDPTVNTVVFTPKARTHWHRHERGQLLVASNGRGLVVSADGTAAVLSVGDIAWIEAGEVHWHGAGADSLLTHVATSLGVTEWRDPVTDDQYADGLQAAGLPAP